MQRKSGCCCPVSGATTTAQEAGAIPVTLGPPNIKAFAPNAHSYLNAHDFDRCVVVCCMQCYVCNTASFRIHTYIWTHGIYNMYVYMAYNVHLHIILYAYTIMIMIMMMMLMHDDAPSSIHTYIIRAQPEGASS